MTAAPCIHEPLAPSSVGMSCRAPFFCRSTGSVRPAEWPEVGYKERRANGKLYTVSAHDLVIRMLRTRLKTDRAEYLRERGAIVRELERANREEAMKQGELF